MPKKTRSVGSIKKELTTKAKEAAISATSIYNSPQIHFKSETYIVLMIIAWTYAFHAYFRGLKIDYRYREPDNPRIYAKTAGKAIKHWGLSECLNHGSNPLEEAVTVNLRLLLGIRHEIEHQMTTSIDDFINAKFQACSMNFNKFLKEHLGDKNGLDDHVSFSLQFSELVPKQFLSVSDSTMPETLKSYLANFENALSPELQSNPSYNYQLFLTRKLTKKHGDDVKAVRLIDPDSELAKSLDITYMAVQEREKNKRLPSGIVKDIKASGFPGFTLHHHTKLWQSRRIDFNVQNSPWGVKVVNSWYWYDTWFNEVLKHCQENAEQFNRPRPER